jgi:hypothetical protein
LSSNLNKCHSGAGRNPAVGEKGRSLRAIPDAIGKARQSLRYISSDD